MLSKAVIVSIIIIKYINCMALAMLALDDCGNLDTRLLTSQTEERARIK